MADFHETRVILLVRSQTGATSRERVEYLLRKPAFDTLRERVGQEQLVKVLDERVDVIDADFGRGVPEIPGGIDIACHSAATVAFDPPIDEGFTTNLQGAMNLYGGVIAGGSTPALVHVSTAYVAGRAEGRDPRRAARPPGGLPLGAGARDGGPPRRGGAVPQARDAERVPRGRAEGARARRSLDRGDRRRGAPAEVGHEAAGGVRTCSGPVRWAGPTSTRSPRRWASARSRSSPPRRTCRSASCGPRSSSRRYTHPFPGWIDGFKMADPIIRAYGLGQIPEFPGIAEGHHRHHPGRLRRERDPGRGGQPTAGR